MKPLTPYQRRQLKHMASLGSRPISSWLYQSTCVAVLRRRGLIEGTGTLRVTDAGRAEVSR